MGKKPPLPFSVHRRFWKAVRAGEKVNAAAALAGGSMGWARAVFREAGGVNPIAVADPAGRYLSFDEREEIMRLHAGGLGVRAIARALGRSPSTISRDLARGTGARGYRASLAHAQVERVDHGRRARRGAKLATNLRLRAEVIARLQRRESPEQIAGRLKVDFPDDPEMWVSTETIYHSLYVQARGGLRRELTQHLRTRRTMRRPRCGDGERRARIPGMVMISDRPAEVEDRVVPGDWEGDLIMGSTVSNTAVGTLVERASGFVMLLHLPHGHGAFAVQQALSVKMLALPAQLRRSLTWDQGRELSNHRAITAATGMDIYFCDPHSPWQRGSNENTNGLLRQYLPKGSDLSVHGEGILDNIAAELNARPRKRHGFLTPAEILHKLLNEHTTNHGVA